MFEDRDADGRFGRGDVVIDNAAVVTEPRGQTMRVGDRVVIENLPVDRPVVVMPDLADAENPYLAPVIPGRLVMARAASCAWICR